MDHDELNLILCIQPESTTETDQALYTLMILSPLWGIVCFSVFETPNRLALALLNQTQVDLQILRTWWNIGPAVSHLSATQMSTNART